MAGERRTAPRELSLRALAMGCLLGSVFAAGNVYAAFKTGYLDANSIAAGLLGFVVFLPFAGRAPYSTLENNITQTVSAAAALGVVTTGLFGPLPAMVLLGVDFPAWAVFGWGIGLAWLGVFWGAVLRQPLVEREQLEFPSGAAVAEVIRVAHLDGSRALLAARTMVGAALFSAIFVLLRESRVVPAEVWGPMGFVGVLGWAGVHFNLSLSPLMASTGVLIGGRNAATVALGAAIAWLGLGPMVAGDVTTQGEAYTRSQAWVLWPGVGVMLGGAVATFIRSVPDIVRGLGRTARLRGLGGVPQFVHVFAAAGVLLLFVCGWALFGIHPLAMALILAGSSVMIAICGRTAGETDTNPISSAGTLMQISFGAGSPTRALGAGGAAAGAAGQAVQMLWAFRAGGILGSSSRAQLIAQLLGASVGVCVAIPMYYVIDETYHIGSEAMPAPFVLTWKVTALLVEGGGSLPEGAFAAMIAAMFAGGGLVMFGRGRRFVPSPFGLGVGFILPVGLSFAMFLGAACFAILSRVAPVWAVEHRMHLGAGGIAGESVMGAAIALWFALNWT